MYIAVRDGDVATTQRLLLDEAMRVDKAADKALSTAGDKEKVCSVINICFFDALWHEPGPEATCLHLAACAVRPELVAWLLTHGADAAKEAGGKTALQMLEAFELFAPARAQRPDDVDKVRALLS